MILIRIPEYQAVIAATSTGVVAKLEASAARVDFFDDPVERSSGIGCLQKSFPIGFGQGP